MLAIQTDQQQSIRKISIQMRAVLMVLSADPALDKMVSPFVDMANECVNWAEIFKLGFCSGHQALVEFAYILWRDEIREGSNPFELALSLEAPLKKSIVKAISIRWGLC